MTDKTKAAVPVVIGAMAIVLALGSVDQAVMVELHKEPTPYSAAHSRVSGDAAAEQPPTF